MAVSNSNRLVQFDDLVPGQPYHFKLRGGFIKGTFGGFIRQRAKPLVIMVPKNREVYSFPVTDVVEIRLLAS